MLMKSTLRGYVVSKEYKTGLEFLNKSPYKERAQEMRELCMQLGEDADVMAVTGETLAYMLLEMYNKGRNEGAAAALLHVHVPCSREIH